MKTSAQVEKRGGPWWDQGLAPRIGPKDPGSSRDGEACKREGTTFSQERRRLNREDPQLLPMRYKGP